MHGDHWVAVGSLLPPSILGMELVFRLARQAFFPMNRLPSPGPIDSEERRQVWNWGQWRPLGSTCHGWSSTARGSAAKLPLVREPRSSETHRNFPIPPLPLYYMNLLANPVQLGKEGHWCSPVPLSTNESDKSVLSDQPPVCNFVDFSLFYFCFLVFPFGFCSSSVCFSDGDEKFL